MLRTLAAFILITSMSLAAEFRPLENRVYATLHGEIGAESVAEIKEAVALGEQHNVEVFVDINSPGGSVFDQIEIVGIMKTSSVPVNTHASGMAASAAAVILAAGDLRTAAPGAFILTHYASAGVSGQLDQGALETLVSDMRAANILLENMMMDFTGHTREFVTTHFYVVGKDIVIEPHTAAKLNLIDFVDIDPNGYHTGNPKQPTTPEPPAKAPELMV